MATTIKNNSQNGFGTFGGVFVPCTLTILGVIMFLRFGQVVGQSGVLHGLLIVLMAKTITTITSLSLSAIATNIKVKGGGAYYLISRSLGIEFGGAIGAVFFLSQALSVAMYVIGFTETLETVYPLLQEYHRLVASGVNFIVFICVFIGAGWTIKLQYGILAVLILAVISFFLGAIGNWQTATFLSNLQPAYPQHSSIWTAFALFFPAATGIMAGANMSGDLKKPAQAIPNGTLASIGVTALVYFSFVFLLAGSTNRNSLLDDTMVVSHLSISAPLILAGIFAATLSSALGSMMGAPRILQALAADKAFVFLNFFAVKSGKAKEPRRAVVLTLIVSQIGIAVGDLNAIAPIITMFFMITYGVLNFATFMESYSHNPSYRPTFRWCHWSVALLGALLCTAVMILIDPLWAFIAIIVMVIIYRYLIRKQLETSWGDINSGVALERARQNLLMLEEEKYHPKNWRPSIMVMGALSDKKIYLAVQGRWLAGEHGMLMLAQVLAAPEEEYLDRHRTVITAMRNLINTHRLQAFPFITMAPKLQDAFSSLMQSSGVGALKPNMVLIENAVDKHDEILSYLRIANRLGKSIGLLHCVDVDIKPWNVPKGRIDVWWLGRGNGELMLLLAHILQTNIGWRDKNIRLLRMISDEAGKEDSIKHLVDLSNAARIKTQTEVIVGVDFTKTLQEQSQGSAMVILGMAEPTSMDMDALSNMTKLATGINRLLYVHSAQDMSL